MMGTGCGSWGEGGRGGHEQALWGRGPPEPGCWCPPPSRGGWPPAGEAACRATLADREHGSEATPTGADWRGRNAADGDGGTSEGRDSAKERGMQVESKVGGA